MNIRYIDLPEWKQLTATNAHFMQTDFWERVKKPSGWNAVRVLIEDKDCTAGIQVLIKRTASGSYGYTGRFESLIKGKIAPKIIFKALKQLAIDQKLHMLTIDPSAYLDSDEGQQWLTLLKKDPGVVLARQIQSRGTAISNLSDFKNFYEQLNKRTRYNIRNAQKKGLSIVIKPATKDAFADFWELYIETATRKGFMLRSKTYYEHLIESANSSQIDCYISYAYHPDEKKPVTGSLMLLGHGRAWLLYAASSMRQRNLMPNDLLEYSNLAFANAHGAKIFDWWGAPFDPNDESDPMYSVWLFKKRFLAEHKQLVGAWNYYPPGLRSSAIKHASRIRNHYLSRRKKRVAKRAKKSEKA